MNSLCSRLASPTRLKYKILKYLTLCPVFLNLCRANFANGTVFRGSDQL